MSRTLCLTSVSSRISQEEDPVPYYDCYCHAVVAQDGAETETECEEAQLQLFYDQDLRAPKLLLTDAHTGEILADMLIDNETEFQVNTAAS